MHDHAVDESCHDAPLEEAPAPPPVPRGILGTRPRLLWLLLWLALTGILVAASLASYATLAPRPAATVPPGATVFYNEACGDCAVYLNDELLPTLEAQGLAPIVVKDYINDRSFRAELTALNDALGIPFTLQSHLATFVRTSRLVVIEGHVPAVLIAQSLNDSAVGAPPSLIVYQDSMDAVASYRAWGFRAAPQEYPITEPLSTYYAWFAAQTGGAFGDGPILGIVVVTGLLDGLNPCAFAVLLFFVAFLYAVRAPRTEVLRTGSLYVYAVFLVYFLIGLGILQAVMFTDDPHFMAQLGSVLVIGLGGLTLASFAFPRVPLIAKMPSAAWARVRQLLMKGTMPSATIAGLAVGLCTFPCSGGIYVAILGFLATRTSFLEGLGYLYLYNLMFVLPLVVMLAVVSNRQLALRAATWERAHAGTFKVVMAASMIAMGVLILALVW